MSQIPASESADSTAVGHGSASIVASDPPETPALVGMFRKLALVGAATIVAYAWVHGAAEPYAIDPMWLRLILAAGCLGIFFSTWFLSPRALVRAAYVAFYVITGWVLWMMAANDLSENYALALIVVASGIAGAFQDRQSLLVYQLATIGGAAAAAIFVDTPRINLPVFFTYALTMATLSYISVSVRLELDRRRTESERRYALAAYGANDGLWDWDLTGGRIFYSSRWKEMLGLADDDVGDDPDDWFRRIHPEDRVHAREAMTPGSSPDVHRSVEYRVRHADGNWRWMLARGAVVRDEEGEAVRMAGSQSDITQRKEIEAQLVHDALHDSLTGLPNRVLLTDRLERLMAAARRQPGIRFAVVYLDVDRFKRINDSQGHEAGDRLLVEVARRLRAHLRDEDTLARVGGDEFVAVLPRLTDSDDAMRAAERLRGALARPIDLDGAPLHLTISMGIAIGPEGYDSPGELLRDADIAMFRCKKERQNRPRMFDEAMHRHAVEQLTLENELRRAITGGQLVLHYQPIVRLESGLIDAWEALVRWRHPARGLLSPAAFLPIAEETGLIVDIGRWALREACAAHCRWAAGLGLEPPAIHVNLSSAHFSTGSLLADVAAAITDERARARLGIEITETVLLEDPAAVAATLQELRSRGIGISIDDFGTGYSSLRYLHSLPADTLKIDRSFIQRLDDGSAADLVQTIVVLAKRLGLTTVAEGIEERSHADALRRAGATHGQGFLYARPMEESDAASLQEKRRPLPA